MEILLNGDREQVAAGTSLLGLLEGLELNPEVVTVSVNGRSVAGQDLASTYLQEGDRVDVLLFMGGGF